MQILVSAASTLRFGLPYAFFTPDLHFVPEIQRQTPAGIPAYLRVVKLYYNKDIDAIVREYQDAKSYGEGAAEEWRKGLHTKGKDAMADAARWEKWEGQMHFGSDLSQVLREYDPSSFPLRTAATQSRTVVAYGTQPAPVSGGKHIPRTPGRTVVCVVLFRRCDTRSRTHLPKVSFLNAKSLFGGSLTSPCRSSISATAGLYVPKCIRDATTGCKYALPAGPSTGERST